MMNFQRGGHPYDSLRIGKKHKIILTGLFSKPLPNGTYPYRIYTDELIEKWIKMYEDK